MATMQGVYTRKVSISGGTSSQWVPTDGGALVGAIIPASMAGTSLQVEMSIDEGATAYPVFDSTGARVSQTIGSTARYTLFPQASLVLGAELVRVVSSATETAKDIILVFQKVA